MRVLIIFALIGAALAAPKSVQRIVGGSPTTVEQYPYMSNMHYHWWGIAWMQWCGGSLITTRAVLSAARCFYRDHESQWKVILGTSYASSGGTTHAVSQLILHPQYHERTNDHDIAIIRLTTQAILSSTIGVARIAGPNYNLADGTIVWTAGWGTLTAGGTSPNQLHHVDVQIINQDLCVERYLYLKTQPGFQNYPEVTPTMLCSGIQDVGGKDACQGDYGGPLAHAGDVIVGITSWSYRCADPFYPGVNVRVSYFTDWISSNA